MVKKYIIEAKAKTGGRNYNGFEREVVQILGTLLQIVDTDRVM